MKVERKLRQKKRMSQQRQMSMNEAIVSTVVKSEFIDNLGKIQTWPASPPDWITLATSQPAGSWVGLVFGKKSAPVL